MISTFSAFFSCAAWVKLAPGEDEFAVDHDDLFMRDGRGSHRSSSARPGWFCRKFSFGSI
jgi:hypothetical protein